MIPFLEAKSIIKNHIIQLETENVPLDEAENRVLAQDVVAAFPSPRFDNSAMDGFAVRSSDTIKASQENPISLKVIGVSSAGSPSKLALNTGECIQCMTGA